MKLGGRVFYYQYMGGRVFHYQYMGGQSLLLSIHAESFKPCGGIILGGRVSFTINGAWPGAARLSFCRDLQARHRPRHIGKENNAFQIQVFVLFLNFSNVFILTVSGGGYSQPNNALQIQVFVLFLNFFNVFILTVSGGG